jgi:hypothetical protein
VTSPSPFWRLLLSPDLFSVEELTAGWVWQYSALPGGQHLAAQQAT